jgi:hypothetical protein
MVLKAGQRGKQVLQVAAEEILDNPTRFRVARVFAEHLRTGDVVQFMYTGARSNKPGWQSTWRVLRISDTEVQDVREIHVIEVR